MENKKLIIVDAETDGLYGSFLTVAMKVMAEDGRIIDQFYCGIKKENMKITEPWVLEHVIPILGDYESCENEDELLEKTWAFWMKHREQGYAVADVPYPVECRLFEACVRKNSQDRVMQAPFPLLDLASVLWNKGFDPLVDRTALVGESQEQRHNALDDVTISVKILQQLLNKNG